MGGPYDKDKLRFWMLPRRAPASKQGFKHLQRRIDAFQADLRPPDIAETAFAVNDPVAAGGGEMHQADRLVLSAAAGTGYAGDRHGNVDARMFQGAVRHGARGFGGYGAIGLENVTRHAEQLFLGLIGISDI